jgi:hypothetical protein
VRTRKRCFRGLRFALPLLLSAAAIHAQPIPRGPEFQVNVYTTGNQSLGRVVTGGSSYLVVWASDGQDGSMQGLFARRFDLDGAPLGGEFQVNQFTTGFQFSQGVAGSPIGFVVVWESQFQDGDSFGVFGRRYDPLGSPQGLEFQVDLETISFQNQASVAMDAAGDFVVVWKTGLDVVLARMYHSDGDPATSPFMVNTHTGVQLTSPTVARDPAGNFVVVWYGDLDGSSEGIFGRRFNSYGNPLGGEFQVNVYTQSQQFAPHLAQSSSGFVVVWESFGQDGHYAGAFGRVFASTGAALTGDFQLNAFTEDEQRLPRVALESSGGFVTVWQSKGEDGSDNGVFLRRFSSNGSPLTGEVQVNSTIVGSQLNPSVAALGSRFAVAWASGAQDGSGYGIFAQRMRSSEFTLDVDGDGSVQPLTDALLILRYAFGFRGAVLIAGAVGGGCTRCDAPAIEEYLAGEL